jgi:large subunit ribosomal protein L5
MAKEQVTTAERETVVPRLKTFYRETVVPEMMKEYGLENPYQVPRIEKIVINMGLGEATQDARILDEASEVLAAITGQKPVVRRARKSIAGFKVRAGMPVGLKVTLRGDRMYEFLDRLIAVALPRVRDFRGLSPKSFDRDGNYTFGVKDQLIFPEVDVDKVTRQLGMDITIVIKSPSVELSRALLAKLNFPFRRQ